CSGRNASSPGCHSVGIAAYRRPAPRVDTVVALVRRGYAARIALAHDAACYTDYFTQEEKAQIQPSWHFRHISDDVIPMLLDKGVTEDDIDTMLVNNPRRYFE